MSDMTDLCKDMVPFQNVDRKGYKQMVKTLNPRYALPASTHFSEQVEKEIPIKH